MTNSGSTPKQQYLFVARDGHPGDGKGVPESLKAKRFEVEAITDQY